MTNTVFLQYEFSHIVRQGNNYIPAHLSLLEKIRLKERLKKAGIGIKREHIAVRVADPTGKHLDTPKEIWRLERELEMQQRLYLDDPSTSVFVRMLRRMQHKRGCAEIARKIQALRKDMLKYLYAHARSDTSIEIGKHDAIGCWWWRTATPDAVGSLLKTIKSLGLERINMVTYALDEDTPHMNVNV